MENELKAKGRVILLMFDDGEKTTIRTEKYWGRSCQGKYVSTSTWGFWNHQGSSIEGTTTKLIL